MPTSLDALTRKIVLNQTTPLGKMTDALFDFDGTLSLLRSGWQEVMVQMMVEVLMDLNSGETEQELKQLVREYVDRLTGRQTIYQMIRLAEEVRRRGGVPKDPLEYKRIYHQRLWQVIKDRVEGIKKGMMDPDQKLSPGSRRFLTILSEAGVRIYLASGTDQQFVEDEARALQIDHFFNGGLFGARDRWTEFDKDILVRQIINEHGLEGPELVSFGDGFVEIEETKKVGGVAIGVAIDEFRPGHWDQWKVQRLSQAGADLLIPDFSEYEALADLLLPGR